MIMLLTTRDNEAISAAQTYYEGRYDESLIDKVFHTTSNSLKKGGHDFKQNKTPPTRNANYGTGSTRRLRA